MVFVVCWVLKEEGINGVLGFKEEEFGGGFCVKEEEIDVG